ncbi:MAG TPA: hypothetical protein DCX53_09470 [Anaerolineae bacterium]|nr:hypothetical protein [Anaerolineae bacterium]
MKSFYKHTILIIGSITLFASGCTASQQTPVPTVSATQAPALTAAPGSSPQAGDVSQLPPDLAYMILLEQVKRSDPDFDFTKLRWTFAQTENYDPYNIDNSELISSMYDAYDNNDFQLAVELASRILEKNYLLPDPHFILLQSYQALGDQQNAEFHNYFLRGIISSIAESGNGRSPETAFIVIQIEEEHFMLTILGLQDSDQSFVEENGVPYDIFTGIAADTNEQTTVYFDISIPYKWLNNSIPQ